MEQLQFMKNKVASTIDGLDKEIHDNYLNEHTQKQTPLDTILKWSPFTLLLIGDVAGLKTKNAYKEHIAMVLAGEVILNIVIQPVKESIKRIRPNGHHRSFPSAHAATGFLTSEILRQELKENYPALKNSGYALSLITCWLRLYHNKHWLSDVVGGALIGALIGKASAVLLDRTRDYKR